MTEEARMEEGRRMFQIFAARMFEQRVLTAYREKVARERQEKLLEELADEDRLDAQREAKKAKEAQKKKDKKRQQKAAKEEERLKKEAEKAAEEAAAREAEERRMDEQRQKRDELRKKREAERRAQEEEKQRKELDKQRRLQEARELQAENERKQRELKEKEKKRKEDIKKERQEKESKEKQRKDRELGEKHERDSKEKAEKESRQRTRKADRTRKEEAVVPAVREAPATQPPPTKKTSAAPPGLGPLPTNHISPHPQIATPIIPKAPTPMRPRPTSNQGSHQSSPKSAQLPMASAATSPSSANASHVPAVPASGPPKAPQALPLSQPPRPSMMPPGIFPDAMAGMANSPEASTPGFSPYHGPMMAGAVPRGPNPHDASMYAQQPFSAPPHRAFHSSNPLSFPPGMNSMRPAQPDRASPVGGPSNQLPIGSGVAPPGLVASAHARQTSMDLPTQPMSRPNPIQRPSSTPQSDETKADAEQQHLGSSALLDDADETLGARAADHRGPIAPVGQRPARLPLGASPVFSDALGSATMDNRRGWGAPPMGFGAPHPPTWPSSASASRPHVPPMGGPGGSSRQLAKPVQLRLLMCEACRRLGQGGSENVGGGRGFHSIRAIMHQMEQLRPASEPQIQVAELIDIVDTEGNPQNGGGTFVVDGDGPHMFVRYIPDNTSGAGIGRFVGGHGDIGSPVTSSALPFGTPRGLGRSGGGIPAPGF